MSTFHLRILSPDRVFLDCDVKSIIVPAADGQYGIMAKHENSVISIVPGKFKAVLEDDSVVFAAVSSGVLRIENGDVLLIVETAEHPDEIDENRAKRDMARAKEALLQKKSIREHNDAEARLARAIARLKVRNKDLN